MGAAAAGVVLQGRYRLERQIGRGGMSDVWAGEDLLLGRRVAVKLFRFDTPGADQRVDAEIRTIAGLNHPGIVTTYDAGLRPDGPDEPQATGGPYLVMELVDGQTLAGRLAEGPLPADQVAMLAAQLADALRYLHGCGVVHRDIKPANILLQPSPVGDDLLPFRARLTDFGTARILDTTRITTAGLTIGTANYLSPEQARGGDVGPATDIYSLGLVLLEAITGEIAYPGFGVAAAVARLHREPHIPAGLGRRWTELLTRMTSDDPSLRPTADDVAAEMGDRPGTAGDGATESGAGTAADGATESGAGSADGQADGQEPVDAVSPRIPGQSAARPGHTRPLPAAAPGQGRASPPRPRWPRAVVWSGLAVVAAAVLAVVLILTLSGGGGAGPADRTPTTPVQYPSVSGQIGQHLRELESAVG